MVYMTRPPTVVPTHVPTPAPPPVKINILCIPLPGQNISTLLGTMIMKLNENATRPLTFNGSEMKAADDSMAISGGGDNGTVTVTAPKASPSTVAGEFHVVRKPPFGPDRCAYSVTHASPNLHLRPDHVRCRQDSRWHTLGLLSGFVQVHWQGEHSKVGARFEVQGPGSAAGRQLSCQLAKATHGD